MGTAALRVAIGSPPMLFCQQCGAPNSPDARFCNQCGAKIANLGEPGGQLEPTVRERPLGAKRGREPERFVDISSIRLSSIGVRSKGQAWGVLVAVALFLVGLGAIGAKLAMHGSEESASSVPDPAGDPKPRVGPRDGAHRIRHPCRRRDRGRRSRPQHHRHRFARRLSSRSGRQLAPAAAATRAGSAPDADALLALNSTSDRRDRATRV